MTATPELSRDQEAEIGRLVDSYKSKRRTFETCLQQVRLALDSDGLLPLIHSSKARLKDPEHLRDKLRRKYRNALAAGSDFDITESNLTEHVTDLIGLRLMHLYTRQMSEIHPLLLGVFEEHKYLLHEEPFARTWDDETRDFFGSLGIKTQSSSSMYTSVHYVIRSNSKTPLTAEIQVRTLAEELWGEVDHTINYPTACTVQTCREQIRVLARVTSSCSRLVDSIFDAYRPREK